MSKVKVGDKIKLKKEMGPLTDIGTICTVKEIDSYGNIIFSNKNLLGMLGYITEDELDNYFEIVKLEELNNNDLNDTIEDLKARLNIEDLKARLKECEEIVAKRKKEQNKVRLGDLEIGDIFTLEKYTAEYRVIDHLSSCTLIINTVFSRDKDAILPAYTLDSDVLVKKVDDQA